MQAKKKRSKNRRRARKLADQAWEAADEGSMNMALKLIVRAVDCDQGNPILWNDQGLLLRQSGDHAKAAESFQAAISLAPTLAESYSHLAAIRLQQGLLRDAIVLQQHAVGHDPDSATYRESLTAYQAMAGVKPEDDVMTRDRQEKSGEVSCPIEEKLRNEHSEFARSVDGSDWKSIASSLTGKGFATMPGLLTHDACRTIRQMFDDDKLFVKTVTMDKERFGRGIYRYFAAPLPSEIDAIRRIVYSHVVRVANAWHELLGVDQRYPTVWEGFRVRCAQFGQMTPTPLLLKYGPGGFNDLHRDIRGEVYFPIQMAIVLSPTSAQSRDGFVGGEFLFCDEPERKKSSRRSIAAGLGDAILFCTRARLVPISGIYGWQPVKHGVDRVIDGTRYVLGVPFHEYQ